MRVGIMVRLRWVLKALLLVSVPLGMAHYEGLSDMPYVWLTGFSERELERLSFLGPKELEARIGLQEVPGGFEGDRAYRGRAAHAIASYLGTRRWGPDVTLAFGYLREYVPALLHRSQADPVDIAANFAGVEYALRELERSSTE
jgi:hypothetical protein